MFLKQLVHGSQPYKFLLIEDTLDGNGRIIVKSCILDNLSKGDEVHFYCFWNLPSIIEKVFSIHKRDRLHFHDFFSDAAGWLRETQGNECKNVFSAVGKQASSGNHNGSVVVIDSISSFICTFGLQHVYRLLHQLIQSSQKGNGIKQILGIIHPDTLMYPDAALTQMRHLFTIWMIVYPDTNGSFKRGFVKISQKKPNAKLFRQIEEFWIDGNNDLNSKKVESNKESSSISNSSTNEIPKELTTFKLGLEDHEKVARSQLVLPYLKSEKTGGTIFYEPDENDDWDEEDPDDDLDV